MSSKERQLGFGGYERSFVKKQTSREVPDRDGGGSAVPFSELMRMIEPF